MKKYILITTIIILIQITVSFLTTDKLVSQNQNYQKNIQKLNELSQINQQLTNQYSHLTSKTYLNSKINNPNLFPIQKQLDISQ